MNPVIVNRRARFEYVLEEEFTAGLMLAGTEVKALRDGKANLSDAYAYVSEAGEVWIKNLHISEFKFGTYANHAPLRERKLLLKKNELKKIRKELQNNGLTMIPLKLYFTSRGWAKLDIALARGKKFYDKRATLKERDIDRDAARE
jgi:SsrA-binding protein